jgi:hypothetical protein
MTSAGDTPERTLDNALSALKQLINAGCAIRGPPKEVSVCVCAEVVVCSQAAAVR